MIDDARPGQPDEIATEANVLKQQSKDLCAVNFDALLKRWDKCINVDGGYVKKYMFSPVRISHFLRLMPICDPFTDSLS
jgi:hypothetical protein